MAAVVPTERLVTGSTLLAETLQQLDVDTLFYLMGGPMLPAERAILDLGLRAIDVRHEQAAAMMAHAYSRVLNRPGVCIACSGPGTVNLATGIANAFADCAPVVALGGSSPLGTAGLGDFQELDQVALMQPITKWSARVLQTRRIPELLSRAVREATSGKPSPVYLDFPGDVLYGTLDAAAMQPPGGPSSAPPGPSRADLAQVERAVQVLAAAERPVVLSGTGALRANAARVFRAFLDRFGIPFYTTPQGRGLAPDDHPLSFLSARSAALRDADAVLVLGTRLNYVLGFGRPPRFARTARFIQVDVDPDEIGRTRPVDVGLVGDAAAVLEQLLERGEGTIRPEHHRAWVTHLAGIEAEKRAQSEAAMATDQVPIHPLRLCKEVRDALDRDAILVVDGQEILNYARVSIPTYEPGHRLNSGPLGCMGVGLPFGIGAKVARPDLQVLVLHGDGSFGMNGMELDTAVRHHVPVVTVISNNGGWTGDPDGTKPGRELGFTRYDRFAEALGARGAYVERPEEIRPALEHAFAANEPTVINVITDPRARASGSSFAVYAT